MGYCDLNRRRLGTFIARYTVIISDIYCTIPVANPGKALNNRVIITSTLSKNNVKALHFFVVFVDLSPMATQSNGSLYLCLKFERNH